MTVFGFTFDTYWVVLAVGVGVLSLILKVVKYARKPKIAIDDNPLLKSIGALNPDCFDEDSYEYKSRFHPSYCKLHGNIYHDHFES